MKNKSSFATVLFSPHIFHPQHKSRCKTNKNPVSSPPCHIKSLAKCGHAPLQLQRKGAEGNPVPCHGSVASTPHAIRETRRALRTGVERPSHPRSQSPCFSHSPKRLSCQPAPASCSFIGLHAVTAPLLHHQCPGTPPFPRTPSLPAQALSSPSLLSFDFDGVVFYFLKCCFFLVKKNRNSAQDEKAVPSSTLQQRDVGDPLVIAAAFFTVTGHFLQALALPGIGVGIRH